MISLISGTSSSQIINLCHEDWDSDQNTEEDGSRIKTITTRFLENLGTQIHKTEDET